jgi:hypothetical protein
MRYRVGMPSENSSHRVRFPASHFAQIKTLRHAQPELPPSFSSSRFSRLFRTNSFSRKPSTHCILSTG